MHSTNIDAYFVFSGQTALHLAVKTSSEKIVQLLLDNDADIALKNKNGKILYFMQSCYNGKDVLNVDIEPWNVEQEL